jgi:hypothetical protein
VEALRYRIKSATCLGLTTMLHGRFPYPSRVTQSLPGAFIAAEVPEPQAFDARNGLNKPGPVNGNPLVMR